MGSNLYLNIPFAEFLCRDSRGPTRCLLNFLNEALFFRDGKLFPEFAFDLPSVPTDLFYVYSHSALSLERYRSNLPVDSVERGSTIKRLTSLKGAQRTLSSPNSNRCWDYLIVFDVLLANHLSLHKENLDVPWVYEMLSRALMNDERMDYILSRPSDFESTPRSDVEW